MATATSHVIPSVESWERKTQEVPLLQRVRCGGASHWDFLPRRHPKLARRAEWRRPARRVERGAYSLPLMLLL
jgi:hypothetical protein